jgi:cytochrome c oxidase subunit 1
MSWIKGLIFGAVGYGVGSGLMALLGKRLDSDATVTVAFLIALVGWLLGAGVWDHWARGWFGMENKPAPTLKSHGVWRYFMFSTDHKVIGIQYLVTFVALFFIAGLLAVLVRIELMLPGQTIFTPEVYNTVMSMHGIVMVAVAVVILTGGFGNYFVPLLIGAEDMAFPRLNALSYWLTPPVALTLVIGSLLPGGYTSGWTVYPPLSERGGVPMMLFLLAFVTFGLSSIIGGLNFIVTVVRLRAPGLSWGRLPIFVWSVFCASLLSLIYTQFVATALIMLVMDRAAGLGFFAATNGGTAILYQHIFWAYSHPAVYVMVLPAFGLTLELITHFSGKPLFGYKWAVGGLMGIVGMSGIVWAHHMFTSGMQDFLVAPFMAATEMISIPTGVIFLAALGTVWQSRMRLTTPMWFALGMIFNFTIGGLTGIFNADAPTDFHLHDTYWVVGHFHYTLMGGEIFAMLAGIYYWFPKITGRRLNESLGKAHFWVTVISFNALYTPMMLIGLYGMNRRIADYPPQLANMNMWLSVSGFVLAAGFLIFIYNVVVSLRAPASESNRNPWNLRTLEWQTSSPPPELNFAHVPQVTAHPYDYEESAAPHGIIPASASAD